MRRSCFWVSGWAAQRLQPRCGGTRPGSSPCAWISGQRGKRRAGRRRSSREESLPCPLEVLPEKTEFPPRSGQQRKSAREILHRKFCRKAEGVQGRKILWQSLRPAGVPLRRRRVQGREAGQGKVSARAFLPKCWPAPCMKGIRRLSIRSLPDGWGNRGLCCLRCLSPPRAWWRR